MESIEEKAGGAILELDVTTNRPDCLSHFGVARETSALNGSPLKAPILDVHEGAKPAAGAFSIAIDDAEHCRRYCGRYIAGVRIGPSPNWLKQRLEFPPNAFGQPAALTAPFSGPNTNATGFWFFTNDCLPSASCFKSVRSGASTIASALKLNVFAVGRRFFKIGRAHV